MLLSLAFDWLKTAPTDEAALLALLGVLLASCIYIFGFSKLAARNIRRIESIPGEKNCLFAFQGWTSYPLVLVMISLGIFLRKYSPIPKPLLASVYIGIGGGLFAASLHYYFHLVQKHLEVRSQSPE